jgi:glutamate dehydrogenase
MHAPADDPRSDPIERVLAVARARLGAEKAGPLEPFLGRYFAHVPVEDLAGQSPESLFGAAYSHWKFAARRPAGTALVRVYNPTLEEHGWKSDRTVVEVVTDDMRFLVESVTAELTRRDLTVHLVVHPVLAVARDGRGNWLAAGPRDADGEGFGPESYMHFRIVGQPAERLAAIRDGVAAVLDDVRAAVDDWRSIRDRVATVLGGLRTPPPGFSPEETAEAREFLEWIHADNFTFLGYREFVLERRGGRAAVAATEGSGLGLLRDPRLALFDDLPSQGHLPPEAQAFIGRRGLLALAKTSRLSTVRRSVFMDTVAVKRMDPDGRVAGVHLFVGLFTATAYNLSVMDIPLLRRKVKRILQAAGYRSDAHDGKVLLNIFETYPRDELFQVGDEALLRTALGIKHVQERPRVALFVRRDDFERFVSCLVYVPRDQFTTDLRRRLQDLLEEAFGGRTLTYYTQLGDSPLARLQVLIKTQPGQAPACDIREVEARLMEAARSWTDVLQEALVAAHGEQEGLRLARRYRRAFRYGYRERFGAEAAVGDVDRIEEVLRTGVLGMNLYRPVEASENQVRLKVYQPGEPIALSDVLPMLEHMGLKVLDEIPFRVMPEEDGGRQVMIHDFGLESRDGSAIDLGAGRDSFQDAFRRVWTGEVESDGFNALVLKGGLEWREVMILRAYGRYLRQAGIAFSPAYLESTLVAHAPLARRLADLFLALFDPAGGPDPQKIEAEIATALDRVASADEDRILRRFLNAVTSTLRTNFFRTGSDGAPRPWLSIKLDSRKLDELPLPRPLVEIFVYSPRVEGIHLRFGKVARGGLRWSDRREDFRTEILGLVKAQVVKNAIIVPVGSKGGFVVKQPPASGDRDAQMAEGIACYRTFVRGLLDLTDNMSGPDPVPPPGVARRDGDDPYLVVAADKGTATFSDIANGISAEYGFWLGDAFASGGSQGYDHKKMGITAKGAWESVKRHFREIGLDTQSRDFTVVGVGDMSGDVFGNGMLLSPHIRLVAAFDHRHVFLDPDPDPAVSLKERERLFALPRSSWADYDAGLISKGGGVFERKAKSIPLSPEVKARLGLKADKLAPAELVKALLRAPVDLLWFGGIGTYVKATDETNPDVGDRANDALRVNGSEIRAKVVGEGANLGFTQRARIEYALKGGRLNADFIDNAGGVNCSDHEVNIKILLDAAVAAGDMTVKQRNALLTRMTDEVGGLVIADNYQQTQAISLIEAAGIDALDDQVRLMRMLEKSGRLDRAVEFLPDDEALAERAAARQGLTRPEIAILMSYAKIWLFDELLQSPLPDDAELTEDLVEYFPQPLRRKLHREIKEHRLRREIVATRVTNGLVNRVGGAFVLRLIERTGMTPSDIARAYTIACRVFGLDKLWREVEALDAKVPANVQVDMLGRINGLLERTTLWFLRNGSRPLDIARHVGQFRDGIQVLADGLEDVMPAHYLDDMQERARTFVDKGVPEPLALRVTGLVNLISGCDVVRLAQTRNRPVAEVARLYFAMGARFRLGNLRASAEALPASTHWQRLATAGMIEEIYAHQIGLTAQVLDCAPEPASTGKALKAWIDRNKVLIDRTEALLSEIWGTDLNDFSQIAVASRQLRALVEAPPSAG